MSLSLVLFLFNAGLVGAVGIVFAKKYRAAEGNTWQRVLKATQDSASMLWNYVILFASDLLAWSEKGAEAFNMPEVQQFLTDHVSPKRLATVMAVIAVVGIAARLRGLMRQWSAA